MDNNKIVIVNIFGVKRGIYGIFIISRCDAKEEQCAYIGKSELFNKRAHQHQVSINNRMFIPSLNDAMVDKNKRIEIRLIEPVHYQFDNYYKDAQRLSSRENYWIDEYQKKEQCLEQVPEGKRPSSKRWEELRAIAKNSDICKDVNL